MDGRLQLFSGNGNHTLAEEIGQLLENPLGKALVTMFSDGETRVRVEENVRGSDIFVVQPISTPADHNLMELLLLVDALRRASPGRITAVIPYYGYAKQEKKTAGREPISAKLVANLIHTAGANRVLTIDLHAPAIEGFFDIPVDHLRAAPILATHFRRMNLSNLVVVSPDAGGVGRANEFRARLDSTLAMISKYRPEPDIAVTLEMVGDVEGKTAIIVDDMICTGATLIEAANMLASRGAGAIYACATHPLLAGDASNLIRESVIKKVVVTNTVPLSATVANDKIEVLTVAPLLAEAIMRIHKDLSISALFT